MTEPLSIRVFDKNFVKRKDIGNPKFVTVTSRHNAVGSTTIAVLSSHQAIPYLMEPSARVVIRDEYDEHVTSGYVKTRRGKGPTDQGIVEFDVEDDFVELSHILGWVVPGAAITDQGTAGDNWEMTGPAETVLKAAVTANATRLGKPLVCAPDLGRGATIKARLRFHPLYERLFPVVDGAGIEAAGIGVTVRQVGDHLELDCYEPSVYPRDLTEAGGAIVEWSYRSLEPIATRTVIGGQGEGIYRMFRTVTDAARETEYARVIERFRDARDTADIPTLYERGQETIDEGAPKVGLSLTLAETETFRYGRSVRVGDKVSLSVGPDFVVDDVLREAVLSWTADAGWRSTPKVGDIDDTSDIMLARAIARLARAQSNSQRT